MTTHETQTLSITIEAPYDEAYAFAREPENFRAWAAGMASALHATEEGWVAETPEGLAHVQFSPPNPHGVLDHHVRIAGKPEIYIPLRMVRNGEGVEVSLLLLRQPEMTDEMFARDADAVRKDLETLKAVLEGRAAST